MSVTSTASNTQVRIATIGSVDDGKSTLIGRLLHDSKGIFEDQLSAVSKASRRYGDGTFNLALLTDGLRAEREQGITIDVAYRYFATPKRSFVLADTPGHAQFTRNMVFGMIAIQKYHDNFCITNCATNGKHYTLINRGTFD